MPFPVNFKHRQTMYLYSSDSNFLVSANTFLHSDFSLDILAVKNLGKCTKYTL